MGIYLNPGNENFKATLTREIYVDKTEMISKINHFMATDNKYVCVSRLRRFGKTIAVNMLSAYYSKGCDSRQLFSPCKISSATAKSDVFTYLIHLGYLAYDREEMTCRIPNKEVRQEWFNAIESEPDYKVTNKIIRASKELFYETLAGNSKAVENALDLSHIHVTSNRSYNNEDALQSSLSILFADGIHCNPSSSFLLFSLHCLNPKNNTGSDIHSLESC